MAEEEYAIVSKKEFMKLKQELDKIKKNPLEGSPSGANLQDSIDNLNRSLTGMMELFKEASDELKIEERDTQIVAKKLDPISEKIETLIEQNQKIAKGIIAVADMVKEKLEEIEAKTSAPQQVVPKEEKKKDLPPLGSTPPPPPPMPSPGSFNPQAPGRMPPPMPEPEQMGPPGFDMPGPMPPPPGERGRKRPILGGFLAK